MNKTLTDSESGYTFFVLTKSDDMSTRILRIPMRERCRWNWTKVILEQKKKLESLKEISFSISYKPEESEEIFVLENFETEINFVNTIEDPEKFNQFDYSTHAPLGIKAIFVSSIIERNSVFFQCFDSRQVISPSKGMILDDNEYDSLPGYAISMGNSMDVQLQLGKSGVGDRLKFKSFFQARKVFDLIDYFNEATNEQVIQFLDNKLFKLEIEKKSFLEILNQNLRKSITVIMNSDILNKLNHNQIEIIASDLGLDLSFKEGKLIIPDKKSKIKLILEFLDSGIWRCPLTNRLLRSNSKIELKSCDYLN